MYSRAEPSPRYVELIRLYRALHDQGDVAHGIEPENTFDGRSLVPHCQTIRDLVGAFKARTLLDYGSGKGKQYGVVRIEFPDGRVLNSIREFWGVDEIRCFDPGYAQFDKLPEGKFDGVICTDVLEHCPEQDLPWIVAELFSFARRFVFATVALYAAGKTLANGENAHCTLKPVAWWRDLIVATAASHPGVRYRFELQHEWGGNGAGLKPDIIEG